MNQSEPQPIDDPDLSSVTVAHRSQVLQLIRERGEQRSWNPTWNQRLSDLIRQSTIRNSRQFEHIRRITEEATTKAEELMKQQRTVEVGRARAHRQAEVINGTSPHTSYPMTDEERFESRRSRLVHTTTLSVVNNLHQIQTERLMRDIITEAYLMVRLLNRVVRLEQLHNQTGNWENDMRGRGVMMTGRYPPLMSAGPATSLVNRQPPTSERIHNIMLRTHLFNIEDLAEEAEHHVSDLRAVRDRGHLDVWERPPVRVATAVHRARDIREAADALVTNTNNIRQLTAEVLENDRYQGDNRGHHTHQSQDRTERLQQEVLLYAQEIERMLLVPNSSTSVTEEDEILIRELALEQSVAAIGAREGAGVGRLISMESEVGDPCGKERRKHEQAERLVKHRNRWPTEEDKNRMREVCEWLGWNHEKYFFNVQREVNRIISHGVVRSRDGRVYADLTPCQIARGIIREDEWEFERAREHTHSQPGSDGEDSEVEVLVSDGEAARSALRHLAIEEEPEATANMRRWRQQDYRMAAPNQYADGITYYGRTTHEITELQRRTAEELAHHISTFQRETSLNQSSGRADLRSSEATDTTVAGVSCSVANGMLSVIDASRLQTAVRQLPGSAHVASGAQQGHSMLALLQHQESERLRRDACEAREAARAAASTPNSGRTGSASGISSASSDGNGLRRTDDPMWTTPPATQPSGNMGSDPLQPFRERVEAIKARGAAPRAVRPDIPLFVRPVVNLEVVLAELQQTHRRVVQDSVAADMEHRARRAASRAQREDEDNGRARRQPMRQPTVVAPPQPMLAPGWNGTIASADNSEGDSRDRESEPKK